MQTSAKDEGRQPFDQRERKQRNISYRKLLRTLEPTHPSLNDVLAKAHRNRTQRLARYISGVRLRGLEELLVFLKTVELSFQRQMRIKRLATLVARARADFETAIEANLAGFHGVVSDSMRDVMEIEFLFREFRFEPDAIDEWLSADQKTLYNKFRPFVLRQRHAARLGRQPQDVAEATDYKAHSMALHVAPGSVPLASKGFNQGQLPFEEDSGFWEIFEHARRLIGATYELMRKIAPRAIKWKDPEKQIPRFTEGWRATQQMQSIFLALLKAATEGAKRAPTPSRKKR